MKKYVLNIDRLYSGQTANALVLNQVDEDFPVLIPSLDERVKGIPAFISKWRRIYPDFNPPSSTDIDAINEYIVEFNIELQTKFKEKGHQELYMMDDTVGMKPNQKFLHLDKVYMHNLNGRAIVEDDDGNSVEVNSSQLNVLFPYKKMSSKSLFSNTVKALAKDEIDDYMERQRGITLQGKVSYMKCLQSVKQVGNNLYVMSPNVGIGDCVSRQIHGNGLTIVNGHSTPYHFPHSMTLFQPSGAEYKVSSIKRRCRNCGYAFEVAPPDGQKVLCPACKKDDISGVLDFVDWYETHNRKTRIAVDETYGGNVSSMNILGDGSYEMVLATYSPTDLVLIGDESDPSKWEWIGLNQNTFRTLRNSETGYDGGKYVISNGDGGNGVGFMFNLYDTFISGNDRVLRVVVPVSKDFNQLDLVFWVKPIVANGINRQNLQIQVLADEDEVLGTVGENVSGLAQEDGNGFYRYVHHLTDTSLKENQIDVVVRIHFDVDFGKRNTDENYRNILKKSGVVVKGLMVENGLGMGKHLTWGDYVNETGISDAERELRYQSFWDVSQYKRDLAYQTVVESSLRNVATSGMEFSNNYSSGDLYGDMFVTKSVLDPRYNMNLNPSVSDGSILMSEGRDYIGMGSCSNQLSLLYKPCEIRLGTSKDGNVVTRRLNPEPDLQYQMVEVVKNINRFESSIKHKSNVFSVVVENSNLAKSSKDEEDMTEEEMELEKYKEKLRDSVTQFVRNTCEGIVPVHTQLFDVQFT